MDKELLQLCDETLKTSDELISIQQSQITNCKSSNTILSEQIQQLSNINQELANPPWYKQYENTFMIGVIGGLVGGFVIGKK